MSRYDSWCYARCQTLWTENLGVEERLTRDKYVRHEGEMCGGIGGYV